MVLQWLDEFSGEVFSPWPFCVVHAVQLAHIEYESVGTRQHAVFFVSEVAFLENHRIAVFARVFERLAIVERRAQEPLHFPSCLPSRLPSFP